MAPTFDFAVVLRNTGWIWLGLAGTFKLVLVSLSIALPLGLPIALLRMSRSRIVAWLSTAYLDLLRTVPTIVLLFWIYFALPLIFNAQFSAFEAAALTLILQYSAFFAEIFRGGIASVERGQWEAARAIGMSYRQQMKEIVLPQAVRRMIPPFFNHTIDMIKTTSIASTISFSELLFEGTRVSADTYRPIETFTVVAAIYFLILFGASLGVRRLEARLKLADR